MYNIMMIIDCFRSPQLINNKPSGYVYNSPLSQILNFHLVYCRSYYYSQTLKVTLDDEGLF